MVMCLPLVQRICCCRFNYGQIQDTEKPSRVDRIGSHRGKLPEDLQKPRTVARCWLRLGSWHPMIGNVLFETSFGDRYPSLVVDQKIPKGCFCCIPEYDLYLSKDELRWFDQIGHRNVSFANSERCHCPKAQRLCEGIELPFNKAVTHDQVPEYMYVEGELQADVKFVSKLVSFKSDTKSLNDDPKSYTNIIKYIQYPGSSKSNVSSVSCCLTHDITRGHFGIFFGRPSVGPDNQSRRSNCSKRGTKPRTGGLGQRLKVMTSWFFVFLEASSARWFFLQLVTLNIFEQHTQQNCLQPPTAWPFGHQAKVGRGCGSLAAIDHRRAKGIDGHGNWWCGFLAARYTITPWPWMALTWPFWPMRLLWTAGCSTVAEPICRTKRGCCSMPRSRWTKWTKLSKWAQRFMASHTIACPKWLKQLIELKTWWQNVVDRYKLVKLCIKKAWRTAMISTHQGRKRAEGRDPCSTKVAVGGTVAHRKWILMLVAMSCHALIKCSELFRTIYRPCPILRIA